MKKYLMGSLIGLAVLGGYKVFADGNYVSTPGPVIAATGQNYSYPSSQAPAPGGVLVQNGPSGTLFNWSNSVVGTTTSLTVNQFPSLPLLTIAQLNALTPATTGQLAMCTNCTISAVCVSSGTTGPGAFIVLSTGTTGTLVACK